MKKLTVVLALVVASLSLAGCFVGKGKGKAPAPVVTKG
jgi:predicted small secreted protein